MPLGQLQFNHQDAATNSFITQAYLEKKIYQEMRDTGVFMDMEVTKVDAPDGNGMQDAKVNLSGNTGAVWTRTDLSGDEARFTLERNIKGTAGYGDSPVRAGDAKAYLHYNVFVNEIDSELIPIPGRNDRRRIKSMIPEFKSSTIQSVLKWHKEEKDFDFHTALLEGSDYGQLLSPSVAPGALGKDLGLGVGVGAPHEIVITPMAGATRVTVPAAGPRSTDYKDNYIAALAALAADNSKFFNRASINAIYQFAIDHKINKVMGANWDYELIVDTAIMKSLIDFSASDSAKNLISLLRTAEQGRGENQKVMDTRGALVIDGVRIIPDMGMDKWRPVGNGTDSGVNAGSPVLTYGDGSRDRRYKTFTSSDYRIGFCALLGGGSLIQGVAEAVETIPVEDKYDKGWGVYGRLTRGVRRGFWESKDGTAKTATEGWLQNGSILFPFNIKVNQSLV